MTVGRRKIRISASFEQDDSTNYSSMFYFRCDPDFAKKQGFSPYETIILWGKTKSFAGHLEIDSSVKGPGLVVSLTVLDILGVSVGATVQFVPEPMLAAVRRCQLTLQPRDEENQSDDDEKDLKAIATAIRYHPLVQGTILPYKGRFYRVSLYPQNQPCGFVGTDSRIKFRQTGVGAYPNCIGLQDTINELKAIIDWPSKYPELYDKFKLEPPRGILLYGPPGCGKTHLVRTISKETGRTFYHTTGSGLEDKYIGESEKNIRKLFEMAKANAPSIIFIDEIDALAPERSTLGLHQPKKSVVTQLLGCMDGLEGRGDVLVIGATNKRESLDLALLRPGRFDKELRVSPPNEEQRRRLLISMLKGTTHQLDLKKVARSLNGYTPADIILFIKQMKILAMTRIVDGIESKESGKNPEEPETQPDQSAYTIRAFDAQSALKKVRTTMLRGLPGAVMFAADPNLAHLGGYDEIKSIIKKILLNPSIFPEVYQRSGLPRPRGILLYGPPGTGKTTLARSLAAMLNSNLILMNAGELKHGIVGQSERKIRELFSRARDAAPTILVLDEIDALCTKSGPSSDHSILAALLSEIDGTAEDDNVLIIGTTNKRGRVSSALTRGGRLELELKMDYPTPKEAQEILYSKIQPFGIAEQDLKEMGRLIRSLAIRETISGADIMTIVRDGLTLALDKLSQQNRAKISEAKGNLQGLPALLTPSDIRDSIRTWYRKRVVDASSTSQRV